MIRYPITPAELDAKIDALVPNWRRRAKRRTDAFIAAGRYSERSGIWSEVKPVFMEVQHNKCAYCERMLAAIDHGGAIEHDLEHFRPKSSVKAWPGGASFSYPTGDASPPGYYWLAYHPLNYAASCKKCNSPLKANYFPVPAVRGAATAAPDALHAAESPYLVFPLGDLDDDPTEVISFLGVNAVSAKKTGPRRRRADVTIAFFELNGREELFRERARLLDHLGNHLETINDPTAADARKGDAKRSVERMLKKSSPHSSCVASCMNLYRTNTPEARAVIQAAREYIDSIGG